jgi:hypothetical protein
MENKELQAILLSQSANYLWDYGTFLNMRFDENYIIELYFIDKKYFEMYFPKDSEDISKIIEITLEELIVRYNSDTFPDEKQLVRKK